MYLNDVYVYNSIYNFEFEDCSTDDMQEWLGIDKSNLEYKIMSDNDIILSISIKKYDMKRHGWMY